MFLSPVSVPSSTPPQLCSGSFIHAKWLRALKLILFLFQIIKKNEKNVLAFFFFASGADGVMGRRFMMTSEWPPHP